MWLWLSAVALAVLLSCAAGSDDLPVIRKGARQGFGNAGWAYDRYKDLPTLDAGKRMLVADLKGPGIIRHFHTTRHHPPELMARGIVLEVWYDDASRPAVHVPLADFFGDGCNGAAMDFSTPLVECAPWSYNAYIPMPFRKRARIYLRNDTAQNTANYAYVEWEPLKKWDPSLGYFHATYARQRLQLSTGTSETFFTVKGAGHLIGRQFSVLTDDPNLRDYANVMEGNNELDIDGVTRAWDYLGTEDSFTFSWGFQKPFAGLRAGMPHVKLGPSNELSIYRFHDHMPIRFDRSLTWRIDWTQEQGMLGDPRQSSEAVAKSGGRWVDYATVFYWYQDRPGGYEHQALPGIELRGNAQPRPDAELAAILDGTPADPAPSRGFDTRADADRTLVLNTWPRTHPLWYDEPPAKGGHPGAPNPGRKGVLGVHPAGPNLPALVLLKLTPSGAPARLRIEVSGDPYEAPGKSDFVLDVAVRTADGLKWLGEQVVDASSPPGPGNWRTLTYALPALPKGPVGIVVKVAYGGKVAVMNEEAFIDEVALEAEP